MLNIRLWKCALLRGLTLALVSIVLWSCSEQTLRSGVTPPSGTEAAPTHIQDVGSPELDQMMATGGDMALNRAGPPMHIAG